jgi:hypothetical protein
MSPLEHYTTPCDAVNTDGLGESLVVEISLNLQMSAIETTIVRLLL